MAVRIIIGLALTVVAFAFAGRRLWWLYRVARTGQPAPERAAAVRGHPGRDVGVEATEVIGQRKLLQWSGPGIAHALTFWGFIVLLLTIIEAYGDLFSRTFAIPVIGHWPVTGSSRTRSRSAYSSASSRSRSSGCATTPSGRAATPGSPGRTPAPPGSSCWGSSW